MKELQIFEAIHGAPLIIGMSVTVDPSNEYASEWPDKYLVTGIQWCVSSQGVNVTIADDLKYSGADGWKPRDLLPTR